MNQQMHNWSKIYYTALYYTAPTSFDAITPDILPSKRSIPDAGIQMYLKLAVIFWMRILSSKQRRNFLQTCILGRFIFVAWPF